MWDLVTIAVKGESYAGSLHGSINSLRGRTLAVLPNFGWVPRDGQGRLAIQMAEAFARAGVPALRIDLPGLGDAPGEHPDRVESFGQWIQSGGQAEYLKNLLAHLQAEWGVASFVIGGICSPFTTTAFAWKDAAFPLAGVVTLDPEFFLNLDPEAQKRGALGEKPGLSRRLRSGWGWMRLVSGENPLGHKIPVVRAIARRFVLRSESYPDQTNMPLVAIWRRMVEKRIPVLMICAEGKIRHLYAERVNSVALRGLDLSLLRFTTVPNTNHVFGCGDAHVRVIGELESWLGLHATRAWHASLSPAG